MLGVDLILENGRNPLPKGWATLPGPADFIRTIVQGLKGGNSVWIYFASAPDSFQSEIRARMVQQDFPDWVRLHIDEDLQATVKGDGTVYWIEIVSDDLEHAKAIGETVAKLRKEHRYPRLCVLARSRDKRSAVHLRELEGVLVRVWSDFVSLTDSRVVVERVGSALRWSRGYISLMSSIISQACKSDIARASVYATRALPEILADSSIESEDIWVGQVQSLFPRINSERKRLIRKYSDSWRIPYSHLGDDSRIVECKENLEIAHLYAQAKKNMRLFDRRDIDTMRLLTDARNELAHLGILAWSFLSDPVALRSFDIKIPRES